MGVDKTSRLKAEFKRLDKNRDGTLDFYEICGLLQRGANNLCQREIRALFDAVDLNGNGRIEFDEFVDFIHSTETNGKRPQTLKKAGSKSSLHLLAPQQVAEEEEDYIETPESPVDPQPTVEPAQPHAVVTDGEPEPAPGTYTEDEGCCDADEEEARMEVTLRPSPSSSSSSETRAPATRGRPMTSSSTDSRARLRRHSAPIFGTAREEESSGPGPGEYVGDYKRLAHQPQQPFATIGHGPGHEVDGVHTEGPGPGAYCVEGGRLAGERKAARATIGHGPGHQPLIARAITPGPSCYRVDHTKEASHTNAARATIGHGPGHQMFQNRAVTPGPSDYAHAGSSRVRGGSIGRAPSPEITEAKRHFKEYDRNGDGSLDLAEVTALLRKGDPQMQDSDIQVIFSAVDKNGDGTIDFGELVDFILPLGRPGSLVARRRLKEAFASSAPGPGSYNTTVARREKIRGGGFGRARRL